MKPRILVILIIAAVAVGGWFTYQSIHRRSEAAMVAENTTKIRGQLVKASAVALDRDLAEAASIKGDWKLRLRLTEVAQAANAKRLARVDELAKQIAATGSGMGEMPKILAEQGIDPALEYLSGGKASEGTRPLLIGAKLAIANGQLERAGNFFQKLLNSKGKDESEVRYEYSRYLLHNRGPREQVRGTLAVVSATYEEAVGELRKLVQKDPKNGAWQADLARGCMKIGDTAIGRGDLPGANRYFDESLKMGKALTALEPKNGDWQSDMALAYDRLGDLAGARGDLAESVRLFGESHSIGKSLTARDPANERWQRELAISCTKLGTIAVSQKNYDDAARYFGELQTIAKTQAAHDPADPDWQRDLANSYNKLGDLAVLKNKLPEAADLFSQGVTIRKALAERDPENISWQRDLYSNYYRLAYVAERRWDQPEARRYYQLSYRVLHGIVSSGADTSPSEEKALEMLRQKTAGL